MTSTIFVTAAELKGAARRANVAFSFAWLDSAVLRCDRTTPLGGKIRVNLLGLGIGEHNLKRASDRATVALNILCEEYS